MCKMCRIFIDCLLLISIVSAQPIGRNKRHLSYFKNLFSSTFYGNNVRSNVQIPNVQAEPECKLYRIPGFDNILIENTKAAAVHNKGSKEWVVYPIESYIGTKNSADTAEAIHNVHKLLSTGILNVPENMLQDAVVPMIDSLNAMKLVVEENISPPGPVTSEEIGPVLTIRGKAVPYPKSNGRLWTVKIDGVKNITTTPVFSKTIHVIPEELVSKVPLKLLKPLEPIHSPKLFERIGPIVRFSARSYPGVKLRESYIKIPNLPMHRIDEIVTLPADQYSFAPVGENRYLYASKRFVPFELEYSKRNKGKKVVPLNPRPLPLVDSDEHEVVNKDLLNVNKNIHEKITLDKINTLRTIGLTPKPNQSLIKDSKLNSSNVTTINIVNNIHDVKTDKIISTQKAHNYSNTFNIVKEKDEIDTDTPFANSSVNKPPVKITLPIIVKTKDKNINANIVKSGDHLLKPETLSQYINVLVHDNKSRTVNITKYKDELQTNLTTDLAISNDDVYIIPIADVLAIDMSNSNVTKTTDIKIQDFAVPKDDYITPIVDDSIKPSDIKIKNKTVDIVPKDVNFSQNINEEVNHTNPHPLVEGEDKDNAKAIVETNSPLHNSSQTIDASVAKSYDKIVKSEDSNIKMAEKLSNDSQNIISQLSHIISSALNILEENNDLKTNISTNSPLSNRKAYVSHILNSLSSVMNYSAIINTADNNPQNIINQTVFNVAQDRNELKSHVVTTSPASIDNDYIQPITNTSPMNYTAETANTSSAIISSSNQLPLENPENYQIHSKDNSTVAADEKKEKSNTESGTVSPRIKIPLDDPENGQIHSKNNSTVVPDDKKERANTESATVSSRTKLLLDDPGNNQIPAKNNSTVVSDDKKETANTESATVSPRTKLPVDDPENNQIVSKDNSTVVADANKETTNSKSVIVSSRIKLLQDDPENNQIASKDNSIVLPDDKKETANTESSTVSSRTKLLLDDPKNNQIASKYNSTVVPNDKKETANTGSATVSPRTKLPLDDPENNQIPSKDNSTVVADDKKETANTGSATVSSRTKLLLDDPVNNQILSKDNSTVVPDDKKETAITESVTVSPRTKLTLDAPENNQTPSKDNSTVVENDKKETANTESTTVSPRNKLLLHGQENDQIPSKDNSIVVPAYQQNNFNESLITVKGNHDGISDNNNETNGRGDIPESSF